MNTILWQNSWATLQGKNIFKYPYLKGVRVSIKKGYTEFKSGYIIIIHFLNRSLCIDPCVVERKNPFNFSN